jgi:hypothetical protein
VTGRAPADASVGDVHHVCLVVPNGTHRPDALARAIATIHADVAIGAIWCGDPQLRPAHSDAAPWWDWQLIAADLSSEVAEAWHEILVADPPLVAEWRAALRTVRDRLDRGARSITVLWVGATGVLGDVSDLWVGEPRFRLVARLTSPNPSDGAMPDDHELAESGRFSPHVATFGRRSTEVLDWLEQRLVEDGEGEFGAAGRQGVGRWLELAGALFDVDVCDDERIGVGAWRWSTSEPLLLDVAGHDVSMPWVLDRHVSHRTRVNIVGHVDRRRALDAAAGQLAGTRRPLTAPGNIAIDDVVRRLARPPTSLPLAAAPLAPPRTTPPSPWARPAAFRRWLADRYWTEMHATRRDLMVAFPSPTSNDAAGFETWSRRAFMDDQAGFLLAPLSSEVATPMRFETVDVPRRDGLNLTGYFRRESSLGDVVRRLAAATEAAGVPTGRLAHERTASPLMPEPPQVHRRIEFATTLAVVNADQFVTLHLDHPELMTATQRMIGYWFWELAYIPSGMRSVFDSVDEIWAGSQFVVDAFAAVAPVPVRRVPIPVARPLPSDRERSSFAPLQGFGDRFVFGVVLDHFSVTERKNPIGTIEAFRRAFAPDEGPVLVVKSMNGDRRWPHHQQVMAAAEGRPDIVIWDEHLSRADHMAFIAAIDCLVSLHRSEGLGLHLAEAMWLGTPTIATRYSGNLDFMDDECAMLIDASLIPVVGGEGVYPATAVWADPDIDVAADAMRRLATEPQLCVRLAAAGRSKMEGQPSLVDTGRLIAGLLDIDVDGGSPIIKTKGQ